MKKLITLLFFALPFFTVTAQISINTDNTDPDASAMLDIKSSTKGVLLPRMTTDERNAINSPAAGLLIYNTSDSCFNYYSGIAWYNDCGRSLTTDSMVLPLMQSGSANPEVGYSIALDASGNYYITGQFSNEAIFGSITLTGSSSTNAFVVKLSPNFEVLWARSSNGVNLVEGKAIAADAAGNVYVAGDFFNTAIFGGFTLTSTGYRDIFIVKYDTNGNVLWVKKAGGIVGDIPHDIAIDANGNCLITGEFGLAATFDNQILTGTGREDIFVVKYDTDGNVLWAKQSGSTETDKGAALTTDAMGNVFAVGTFRSSISFGSQNLTSTGEDDLYLVKYDPLGNVLWAKSYGGPSFDYIRDIALATDGSIFITGAFISEITLGTNTLISAGAVDIFTAKLDSTGTPLWAKQVGGTGVDFSSGIGIDQQNNCYVTGTYIDAATFGTQNITSQGGADIFTIKYDSDGNLVWVKSEGGENFDQTNGIVTTPNGTNTILNAFEGTAIFGTDTLTSNGFRDVLLKSYSTEGANMVFNNGLSTVKLIQSIDLNNTVLQITESGNTKSIDLNSIAHLGNHKASQNIQLSNHWLSNTGSDNGLKINNLGEGTVVANSARPLLIQHNTYSNGSYIEVNNSSGTRALFGVDGNGFSGGDTTDVVVANWSNGDLVLFTDASERMRIDSVGKVGIGRKAATNRLEVNGTASKTSAGNWVANSDARLKKNITSLSSEKMLNDLLSLQGVTYEWNDHKTGNDRPMGIQYGFTAQNIQTVFPTLVKEDNLGYLQTAYGTYDAMTVEAIRALNDKIEQQNERIQFLESQASKVNQLENLLQQLQQQVQANANQVENTSK